MAVIFRLVPTDKKGANVDTDYNLRPGKWAVRLAYLIVTGPCNDKVVGEVEGKALFIFEPIGELVNGVIKLLPSKGKYTRLITITQNINAKERPDRRLQDMLENWSGEEMNELVDIDSGMLLGKAATIELVETSKGVGAKSPVSVYPPEAGVPRGKRKPCLWDTRKDEEPPEGMDLPEKLGDYVDRLVEESEEWQKRKKGWKFEQDGNIPF